MRGSSRLGKTERTRGTATSQPASSSLGSQVAQPPAPPPTRPGQDADSPPLPPPHWAGSTPGAVRHAEARGNQATGDPAVA